MQKSKIFLCSVWKMLYLCTRIQQQVGSFGEMAERSNAAVLKTVEGNTSGGSNPSFSAYCIMFSNKKRLSKKQSLFLLP